MSAASGLYRLFSRVGALVRWRRLDRDLDEDLATHLDLLAQDQMKRGLDPEAARRAARIQMGSMVDAFESHREARSLRLLETVVQDVRYGARSLLKYRWHSLTSLVTLVVAVGLVVSVATTFNAVFLRTWPVPDADEVFVAALVPGGREVVYRRFEALRERATRSRLVAIHEFGIRIGGAESASGEDGLVVSPDFFEVLGVRPLHGRGFTGPTTPGVREAVISHGLWRRLFGGDPGILGTTVSLNEAPTTIVGILGPGFRGIPPERSDVYVPFPSSEAWERSWASWWAEGAPSEPARLNIQVAGRITAGWTRRDALAELELLYEQSETEPDPAVALLYDPATGQTQESSRAPAPASRLELFSTAMGQRPGMRGGVAGIFALLFAASLLVVVLASANVANLQMARNLVRRREIATRLALGAGRARVVGQLLTEGLLLAGLAGAGALAVAAWLPSFVFRTGGQETYLLLIPDGRVFAFSLLVCAGAAIPFALLPALRATRRSASLWHIQAGESAGPRMGRSRRMILALQVAISMVLLLSATLLVRDLRRTASPDHLGFESEIAVATLHGSEGTRFWNPPEASFMTRLRNGVGGLDNVTMAYPGPFEGWFTQSARLPGSPSERSVDLALEGVASGFFGVLGVPLVSGRVFADAPERNEIVVSEAFMRAFEAEGVRLGSQVVITERTPTDVSETTRTIVGVVPDLRLRSVGRLWPTAFQPLSDARVPTILLGTDPASLVRLEAAVGSVDPDVRIETRPLDTVVAEDTENARAGAWLASALGLAALGLAIVGVFGVFGCVVEERRREIGIHMALGATGGRVVGLLFEGARMALVPGLIGGAVLSAVAVVLLRGFLYGLSPLDLWTYVAVGAILVASGAAATWFPARRAVRIDPAVTLRAE